MLSRLQKHWLALVLAVTIGVVCIAPYVYVAMQPQYQGVMMMGQDAEEHYVARTRELYGGYGATGNTYLPFKDEPYLIPPLGEIIVGIFGITFFLTAAQATVAAKFLFPALAFLCLYAIGYLCTHARAVGLLGATLAMLGNDLMSYPRNILPLLRGTSAQDGIYWARPVNPEVSGTVLFFALLILAHVLQKKTMYVWQMFTLTLLFGLSIYISPYTWSFMGILLLLILGWTLWQKNYPLAKRVFAVGGLGALIGTPFVSNYLAATHAPGYAAAALHQGVLASHQPVIGLWVILLIAIPFIWAPKHLQPAKTLFVLSGVGLLVLLNQQVLTGVYLQPGHYHWYITKPLVGLLLGWWLMTACNLFVPKKYVPSLLASAIIVFLLYGAVLAQVSFYHKHAPSALAAQAYAPLLTYLRTQGHQVVYANEDIATYVPVHTNSDAPTNEYANMYLAPVGYFDELSVVQKDASKASILQLHKLGITLVVVDTKYDEWRIPTLPLKTTIAGRFAVYQVPAFEQPL